MRKIRLDSIVCLIILGVGYMAATPAASAATQCFGVGGSVLEERGVHLKLENRFQHCQKGDILSVYTKSLDNAADAIDINSFAMRINEVGEFCDFRYPVVAIGETRLREDSLTVRWFSCVYLGQKRDSRFPERKSR